MEQQEFIVTVPVLNLYDSEECTRLATQAWAGRHLAVRAKGSGDHEPNAGPAFRRPLLASLLEDGYDGWLATMDALTSSARYPSDTSERFCSVRLRRDEIEPRLGQVVAFALAAGEETNRYLWGGTTGPDFDCSGLVQRAFASQGIWVPRDAYQQEGFASPVPLDDTQPGDLVFFGRGERATHVGLCVAVDKGLMEQDAKDTSGQHIEYDKNRGSECQIRCPSSTESNVSFGITADKERGVGSKSCEPNLHQQIHYIHSSGKDHGHDGIAIDILSQSGGSVALHYLGEFRGIGRVDKSLCTIAFHTMGSL